MARWKRTESSSRNSRKQVATVTVLAATRYSAWALVRDTWSGRTTETRLSLKNDIVRCWLALSGQLAQLASSHRRRHNDKCRVLQASDAYVGSLLGCQLQLFESKTKEISISIFLYLYKFTWLSNSNAKKYN